MSDLRNLKQGNQAEQLTLTAAQIKRRVQFAALVGSLKPRKSAGFSITPAADAEEKERRFALRRGSI